MGNDLTIDDLVKRNGLYYKKFTNVPFTGEVSGQVNGELINGKEIGEWEFYNKNGQLIIKGNYKDGKEYGRWVEYSTMVLCDEGFYKDGKRDGRWEYYSCYGFPRETVYYINGGSRTNIALKITNRV